MSNSRRRDRTPAALSQPGMADGPAGYQLNASAGGVVRSDIVDVYIFRAARARASDRGATRRPNITGGRIEFLQLLRASAPLEGTWHPVMGHIEPEETATDCAIRELREEVGLVEDSLDNSPPAGMSTSLHRSASTRRSRSRSEPSPLLGLWALEQVHPYFIAPINTIVLSPRFAAEVRPKWSPVLNDEHTKYRWVPASRIARAFMWPGQVAACREILQSITDTGSLARARLRLR